ncbi:jg27150, partial [Pararge aegeria aegeria]
NNDGSAPAQSPRAARKRFGSASEETILKQVNGGNENGCVSAAEWDNFKQDVLREIRSQVTQMKREILDAMKAEFARRVLVEKLIVPLEKSSPVKFSDVTNLDLNSLKKPIIDRKKTILSKHKCEICLKYLSTNYYLTRHMMAVHGIRRDNNFDFLHTTRGTLHCSDCEEDFALPSLLENHNCTTVLMIQVYSIDFDIPAPIVELTEYDNV